ncbi:MAG: hypothetical protein H7069_03120 [Phormidesmis sp. FL-bin-119]|nr:hypothetical protein [Pedobacter sp.]
MITRIIVLQRTRRSEINGPGKSVSEISNELSLSINTISTHRARTLEKMMMHSNAEVNYSENLQSFAAAFFQFGVVKMFVFNQKNICFVCHFISPQIAKL